MNSYLNENDSQAAPAEFESANHEVKVRCLKPLGYGALMPDVYNLLAIY